ncbi:hypothetical protein [Dactylosporangium sp. NPDC051484]|uniref:DUF7919 family protein n=1 Tax=Dactylosporangium sp. NPDC051484 TaxID=3154942 RepID=UPI00344DC33E
MEYPDLSPYVYRELPMPMRCVGWLGPQLGIQGGGSRRLDDPGRARLRAASWNLVSISLGWHECEFCPAPARFQGNGEYRYYCRGGAIYSAPMMILHYVGEHEYRPPAEFLADLGPEGGLEWDWRADRLATAVLDQSEDLEIRAEAVADIVNWREPRALDVLWQAARDGSLALAGFKVGQAIGHFAGCDFAGDLLAEDFHSEVRQGIHAALSAAGLRQGDD